MAGTRRWTERERELLRRIAREGKPTRAIARVLGRSRIAVRVMACRLKVRLTSPVGRPRSQRVVTDVVRDVAATTRAVFGAARFAAFEAVEAALGRLYGGCSTGRDDSREQPGTARHGAAARRGAPARGLITLTPCGAGR